MIAGFASGDGNFKRVAANLSHKRIKKIVIIIFEKIKFQFVFKERMRDTD